jgi:hypothetical protein
MSAQVTVNELDKINRFLMGYKGAAIIRQIVMAQNLPTLMDVGTAVISQERAEQGHKVNAALHSTAQGAAARAFSIFHSSCRVLFSKPDI